MEPAPIAIYGTNNWFLLHLYLFDLPKFFAHHLWISGLTPICSCPRDMTGDPFVSCRPFTKEDLCRPNPCGTNAQCVPGHDNTGKERPVCTCLPGNVSTIHINVFETRTRLLTYFCFILRLYWKSSESLCPRWMSEWPWMLREPIMHQLLVRRSLHWAMRPKCYLYCSSTSRDLQMSRQLGGRCFGLMSSIEKFPRCQIL